MRCFHSLLYNLQENVYVHQGSSKCNSRAQEEPEASHFVPGDVASLLCTTAQEPSFLQVSFCVKVRLAGDQALRPPHLAPGIWVGGWMSLRMGMWVSQNPGTTNPPSLYHQSLPWLGALNLQTRAVGAHLWQGLDVWRCASCSQFLCSFFNGR